MLLALFSINYAAIIGSLVTVTLLIAGLTYGLRLMKVSNTPAWWVGCFAILGAASLGMRGGVSEMLILLFGVPLLGAAIYLIVKLSLAKQAGIVAAIGLCVVGFLFLLNSGYETRILSEQRAYQSARMREGLMAEQAAIVRKLRAAYDRQRRELFDSRASPSQTEADPKSDSSSDEQLLTLKSSSGVAWYPEVDERFDVDVQPSMAAAGKSLGRTLIRLIDRSAEEEPEPPIIHVYASRTRQRGGYVDALNGIASVMRKHYPEAQVLVDHVPSASSVTRLDRRAISIRLSVSVADLRSRAPWDQSKSELLSDVFAELDIESKKVSTSVRVIDKPWVHDFDQFLNSSRGNGIVVDGRSGRLTTTQAEARDAAIEDAVSMLTPIATEVLKAQKQLLVRAPDEIEIAERLKQELLAGQLIVDSFSQQLSQPMGNLWREAVLVRVDYSWLEQVFSSYLQQRQEEQRDRLSLGAALALLVIGIIVLHGGLNWITKGYHRKSVGMLSALIAVVSVLAVLIVALKFSVGHV